MKAIWDLLVHAVNTSPEWLPVMLLAWFWSVGFTLAAKPWAPSTWSPRALDRGAQAIASVAAFIPCFLLWPTRWGAVAGIAVGLWSPTSWWLLKRWAVQRWPWLAARMANDRQATP